MYMKIIVNDLLYQNITHCSVVWHNIINNYIITNLYDTISNYTSNLIQYHHIKKIVSYHNDTLSLHIILTISYYVIQYHIIQYHSKRLNIILNDKISHAYNYCILHNTISYETISYHDSYCFMM